MLGISGYSPTTYSPYPLGKTADPSSEQAPKSITGEKTEEKESAAEERAKKRSGVEECETCASRKYQDGSDENVSFKAAAHVSPQASGAAVRAHEQEHVANAYDKAKQDDGKVMRASVSIHTAVCPECGRTYVSGGETTTQIKYSNEDNPYQKARKAEDADKYTGMNVNLVG